MLNLISGLTQPCYQEGGEASDKSKLFGFLLKNPFIKSLQKFCSSLLSFPQTAFGWRKSRQHGRERTWQHEKEATEREMRAKRPPDFFHFQYLCINTKPITEEIHVRFTYYNTNEGEISLSIFYMTSSKKLSFSWQSAVPFYCKSAMRLLFYNAKNIGK